MAAQQRPLSPHLDVYKWQITMVMSIMHRATGVFLALGALGLTAWLLASAGDNESFTGCQAFLASPLGKLALAAFTASLVYHFLNGIRHLLWDVGWGFEIPQFYGSGYVVLSLTAVITLALVYVGLNAGGAA
jgi:succinate dehydrogenase / fumarate reductase cytochrome b subunit